MFLGTSLSNGSNSYSTSWDVEWRQPILHDRRYRRIKDDKKRQVQAQVKADCAVGQCDTRR